MIHRNKIHVNLVAIFLFLFASGCATTMVVTPQIAPMDNVDFRLMGKVVYDGNREYLPRTVSDDAAPYSSLAFRYTYDVTYGRDRIPQVIPLFNPLTTFGFPIGEDTLVVAGKLELLRGTEVIKSYQAMCAFEKTRNIFSEGETSSELRKKGLISVRNNIEAQMCKDREYLSKLRTAD